MVKLKPWSKQLFIAVESEAVSLVKQYGIKDSKPDERFIKAVQKAATAKGMTVAEYREKFYFHTEKNELSSGLNSIATILKKLRRRNQAVILSKIFVITLLRYSGKCAIMMIYRKNGVICFMEFSEQIKYVRLKLHMSQTEFAQLLGVSFTSVNRWENGKTTPNYRALRTFEQLCKDKNISLENM